MKDQLNQINTVNDINLDSIEGKLFFAALAKLTTESQTNKTPDEVLAQCKDLALKMSFI